ncbi:MAG: acetoacetate--CoA ligase [Candidatus Caldarchaeum sp.]
MLLWSPSSDSVSQANMKSFIEFVDDREGLGVDAFEKGAYFKLYRWSVSNIPRFWEYVWDFFDIVCSRRFMAVVDDLSKFPGARWFVGARLNFAENLLRHRGHEKGLIGVREDGEKREYRFVELHGEVAAVARGLREVGVGLEDRVAGYIPNIPESVVAMLAATSLGATWSSVGTELGVDAVVDRLGQVEPKVLFTVDGYYYRGRAFDVLERIEKIVERVPSIRRVVVIPYLSQNPRLDNIEKAVLYGDFKGPTGGAVDFAQVSSSTPVYVMFSSGTTGKPKCMVQPVAGILVNQLKDVVIHSDLKRGEVITYITTPSWMMWNWSVSSLAAGGTVLLYDGDPNYPDWRKMWRLIDEYEVSIFGCSASYINHLRGAGAAPGDKFGLESLREISQTGSPLLSNGFKWVYDTVKKDLHFNSISGGTDINGCFAIGSPILPVYAGQVQSPGLGMKIMCYDERGEPVFDREGELVCEAPAPPMPLYFLNDQAYEKYLDAYFRFYTHKRVWRHGDYVIFHSDTGGITFLGRSDATLKPSGVRIGTAEIYSIVEGFREVADSLAVGQDWRGDQRVILFVKMAQGYVLTDELKERIKRALREKASPRHVPAIIMEAPDIPYTYNMKKVEIAVSNIINGRKVTNREAIRNPETLEFFEKVAETLRSG